MSDESRPYSRTTLSFEECARLAKSGAKRIYATARKRQHIEPVTVVGYYWSGARVQVVVKRADGEQITVSPWSLYVPVEGVSHE